MLQVMEHMEASCVFYVEVGTLSRHEQSNIWVSIVTTLQIAMLTIHQYIIYSICFM